MQGVENKTVKLKGIVMISLIVPQGQENFPLIVSKNRGDYSLFLVG